MYLKSPECLFFFKKKMVKQQIIYCVYLTPINFHKKGDGRGDDKGKGPR